MDCFYFDFKMTLDKIPHKHLVCILKNVGELKGNILKLMEDYLSVYQIGTAIRFQE